MDAHSLLAGSHAASPLPAGLVGLNPDQAEPSPSSRPQSLADAVQPEEEDIEYEDEEEGTYSSYMVSDFCKEAVSHPSSLVETLSLAAIKLPTLERLEAIKKELADIFEAAKPKRHKGDDEREKLSAAQLEAVVYAWAKFTGPRLSDGKVPGFFLGDGTGVGKGRTIAGLIRAHWMNGKLASESEQKGGRHILWISASPSLDIDANRDLREVGAYSGNDPITLFEFRKKTGAKIPKKPFEGVVFITYSLLVYGLGTGEKSKSGAKTIKQSPVGSGVATTPVQQNDTPSASSSKTPDSPVPDKLRIDEVHENSRLAQVIRWLKQGGESGKGALIILDESHRAKNADSETNKPCQNPKEPSQTARAIVHLQEVLPDAKVLYSSATGASEPRNLKYMTRLWGTAQTFITADLLSVSKLAALEFTAMSLKAEGSYIARTLSYEQAEFELETVEVSEELTTMYKRASQFWMLVLAIMERVPSKSKTWRTAYALAHQRFFKDMVMAAKVPACEVLAKESVANGMSVVIGLQTTGEAANKKRKSEAMTHHADFVSVAKHTICQFLHNHFPTDSASPSDSVEYYVRLSIKQWREMMSGDAGRIAAASWSPALQEQLMTGAWLLKGSGALNDLQKLHLEQQRQIEEQEWEALLKEVKKEETPRLLQMRNWLVDVAKSLQLPPNPLDDLIDRFGGRASVAEISGRAIMEEREPDGRVKCVPRQESEALHEQETNAFMRGEKRFAIISDAGSTGISLQASNGSGSANFRRLHITLELPWSADKAIQQFGRTHRSNQASAPLYSILVSTCAGETRFACSVAKRLKSLKAVLKGDRNALGPDNQLKNFDVDSNEGSEALRKLFQMVGSGRGNLPPGVSVPILPIVPDEAADPNSSNSLQQTAEQSQEDFFSHFRTRFEQIGAKQMKVTAFLNRVLGLPIDEQALVFKLFADMHDAIVAKKKKEGTYDTGIVSVTGRRVVVEKDISFPNAQDLNRLVVSVDQGTSFYEAQERLNLQLQGAGSSSNPNQLAGFYIQERSSYPLHDDNTRYNQICLVMEVRGSGAVKMLRVRPWGQVKPAVLRSIPESYRRIEDENEAERIWDAWFNHTEELCMHGNNCSKKAAGCSVGRRVSEKHLIRGAVLKYWGQINKLRGEFLARQRETGNNLFLKPAVLSSLSKQFEICRIVPTPDQAALQEEEVPEEASIVGICVSCAEEADYLYEYLKAPQAPATEDVVVNLIAQLLSEQS